jgi:hypothetical protein
MSLASEIRSIFRRVLRVSATFFVLALSACSIAWLAKVPTNELGVAVIVPVLWLFAMSRIFIVALPPPPSSEQASEADRGKDIFFAITVWVLSGIAAIDFFLSAITFSRFGVADLASKSYALSGFFGEACAAVMLLILLLVLRSVFRNLADAMVDVVRSMLRWPADLADALSLPTLHHH